MELLPTWQQPLLDYSSYHPAIDLYAEHSDAEGDSCSEGEGSSEEEDEDVWKFLGG